MSDRQPDGKNRDQWIVRVVALNVVESRYGTDVRSEAIYGPFPTAELASYWIATKRGLLQPIEAPQVMPLTEPAP